MNKKLLYTLWAILFILCAGFGFIPQPADTLQSVMTVLSLVFFLPPALLLWHCSKTRETDPAKLIRNLSALSLGLTMVLLILNFLAATGSAFLGQVLHNILVIVSSPMVCSGRWAMSLFFWACLLMASAKQTGR